jgi:uncharacterized protein YbjT (DUF2867 family)
VKILIAGANGKVGTILCGKLWGVSGFSPVGLIRDARQQTKFTALGVPSVLGDLEDGIASFLPGLDAVVFTAGSGNQTSAEKTTDVDQNSAVRLIGDCESAGVKRFIMVSAIGADPNSDSPRIQHYLRAKGVADSRLRSSQLDYTILAPGTLIDERGTGRVQVAEDLGFHGYLPREDLVDLIIECLKNWNSIGKTLQIVSGGQKVRDALIGVIGGGLPPIA